jgi:hypothetical protein
MSNEPVVAWMFQHEETGRMSYVSNDGMNTPALFLSMNPRYTLVCVLYGNPVDDTALLRQALEALENAEKLAHHTGWSGGNKTIATITALRERLKEKA